MGALYNSEMIARLKVHSLSEDHSSTTSLCCSLSPACSLCSLVYSVCWLSSVECVPRVTSMGSCSSVFVFCVFELSEERLP